MRKRDDGGPAYPGTEARASDGHYYPHPGMSLRDRFASNAPPMTDGFWEDSEGDGYSYIESVATWNYLYADCMLAEREK